MFKYFIFLYINFICKLLLLLFFFICKGVLLCFFIYQILSYGHFEYRSFTFSSKHLNASSLWDGAKQHDKLYYEGRVMTYTFIPVVFFPLTVFKVGHIQYNRMRKWAIWIVVLFSVMIFVGTLHVSKQWDWSMIHILNLFLITYLKWVNCLVNDIMHIFRRTHFRRNRVINHSAHSGILMTVPFFIFYSDDMIF